jgi:hypothetical protein
MFRYGMACAMLLMSALSCVPIRPTPETGSHGTAAAAPASDSGTHATAPAVEPAPAQAADPDQEAFETRVLPILQDRCSPCHFEGGKMYARMPFDQPGTIRVLGTALFSRIRDEEERQAIREFLGVGHQPPEDTPPGP